VSGFILNVSKGKKLCFYESVASHVLAIRPSILISTENYYDDEIKWDVWDM
jgi:hypothetical protein